MATKKPYDSILFRDGVSKQQRSETVLFDPEFFKVDERSLEELIDFAKQFSEKIHFYGLESEMNPDDESLLAAWKEGSWKEFFSNLDGAVLQNLQTQHNLDPHLGLFLAFLKLFGHAQHHQNQFTQKHLNFYYREILGLAQKSGMADNAFVIFELAKHANEALLPAHTLLDAGKIDTLPRQYQLAESVVINKARVSALRTITRMGSAKDQLCFANQSDTQDGISKKLNAEAPYWDAFGLRHIDPVDRTYSKTGFAIAAPALLLKGGDRNILFRIQLSGIQQDLNTISVSAAMEVFFTGEKKWLGGFTPQVRFDKYDAATTQQQMIVELQLGADEAAIVPYQSAVHGGGYETLNPVAQFLLNTAAPGNVYPVFQNAQVQKVSIELNVKGITELKLENDLGELDARRPFQPFGPEPRKGSSFSVLYPELMQKNITGFGLNIEWLDAPSSLNTRYSGYETPVQNNSKFKAHYRVKGNDTKTTELFNCTDASQPITWPSTLSGFVWQFFPVTSFLSGYASFHGLYSNPNFSKAAVVRPNFSLVRDVVRTATVTTPAKTFVRFELAQGFLHDEFGRVFTSQAMRKAAKPDDASIKLPQNPYTPVIKSISLDYTAKLDPIDMNQSDFSAFNQKELQFFHIGVFGQAEQHGFLKLQAQQRFQPVNDFDTRIFLMPRYALGNFFIGLQQAIPGQSVSVLFQLGDGTADPDLDTEAIEWAVLCNNEWRSILKNEFLKEETQDLSQTGIIRMVLPQEATDDNTWMDAGYIWIRAQIKQHTESVCLFNTLLAQAARAVFISEKTTPDAGAVPAGTITKLPNKPATIKSVQQPFSSFGGRSAETESAFTLRVSERLRHKDRGVMNWDYEHLVLQQFPELYKVKCLNHFNDADDCCKELHPGHVTLVVVPDIRNKNAYNPMQPKVSGALRAAILNFVQARISFFTTLHVVNPDYETVLLDFKVRFNRSGDFGLYANNLNQALVAFLTPWAFEAETEIHFGGNIKKSTLLNFLEELPYVDFVTNLQLFHVDERGHQSSDLNEIILTNPKAILISHARHQIREFTPSDICV